MAHRMSFDRSIDNDLTRPGPARLASIAPIESTDQSDPMELGRLVFGWLIRTPHVWRQDSRRYVSFTWSLECKFGR